MKKGLKLTLLFIFLFCFITNVKALSVDKNNINIAKGKSDNINLYVDTEEDIIKVEFTLIYSSYDIPATFIINNAFSDETPSGIKHTIIFDSAKKGKITLGNIKIDVVTNPKVDSASVNIHTAKAITTDGKEINLNSQLINVYVKEEEDNIQIDKNMLKSIDSKLVKIDLKKDIFEYDITIDSSIEELDLKPVAINDDVEIDITTQKIKDIKNNKILITTKLNDIEQVYTINILVKEDNKIKKDEIIIDKTKFVADDSYKSKWLVIIIALIVIFMMSLIINNIKPNKKHKHR